MHFLDEFVFFLGEAFDVLSRLAKSVQERVLPRRDTVHPPEADRPADRTADCEPELRSGYMRLIMRAVRLLCSLGRALELRGMANWPDGHGHRFRVAIA